AERERARAGGGAAGGGASLILGLGGGGPARVAYCRAPGVRRSRLQVVAEAGSVTAAFPRRLTWVDAAGAHAHTPPGCPAERTLLEQFHGAITDGQAPAFDLAAAYHSLGWLRRATRSRADGRRIPRAGSPP